MLKFDRTYRNLLKENVANLTTGDMNDLLALDENTKVQVSDVLLKRLLQSSAGKVKDVDFGDIPDSQGDITKVKDYQKLLDSLDVVEGIAKDSGKTIEEVQTVRNAIKNIESRKEAFGNAFVMKDNLMVLIYVTTVMGIYYATSHLITVTIEYVRDPDVDSIETIMTNLDYNKDRMLALNNLQKFNQLVDAGDLDKLIKHNQEKNGQNFSGTTALLIGVSIIPLASLFIYTIRELVYLFYFSRIKFADFCELQMEFLNAQAEFNNSRKASNGKDYKKIAKKQKTIVKKLEKIRNFVEVQNNKAVKQTVNQVRKDKPVESIADIDKELTDIGTNNTIII